NTHLQKVPERYRRKQTLSNAERFYTDELLELERKVLSAQAKRIALEKEMWTLRLRDVVSLSGAIKKSIQILAPEDILAGFAWLSLERNYVRPSFDSAQLKLVRSRHPLLELKKSLVVQDNSLDFYLGQVLLLTGPNMAGKSTLMRQLALICLMAQVGSFVPAEEAILPLFDRILTRIGAHDQILKGRSTFMVEMLEIAEILQPATGPSLIILDEVGRGTSTYDGLSLAQALLEEFLHKSRGFVVFATHYHELTQLQHPRLCNAHLKIEIRGEELQFLHQLVLGPAGKSYGIQVAKKAGLPVRVLRRAEALLQSLESPQQLTLDWHSSESLETSVDSPSPLINPLELIEAVSENSSLPPKEAPKPQNVQEWELMLELRNEVLRTDPNSITPLAALQKWDQWKQRLKEHGEFVGSNAGHGVFHA
ncbi:MAG: DNA mismatch repair protein MutS, partial [Bdellovibrio sp.]